MRMGAARQEALHLHREQVLQEYVVLVLGLPEEGQQIIASGLEVAEEKVVEPDGLELVKLAPARVKAGRLPDERALLLGLGRRLVIRSRPVVQIPQFRIRGCSPLGQFCLGALRQVAVDADGPLP